MKDLSCELPGPAPLLAALDAKDQIHLIVSANPLAAARCTKCLDVGAIPIVIAPEGAEIHSTLLQKIEDGRVRRIAREFQDDDLKTLGRDEVDNFVDAVFVTLGRHNPLSSRIYHLCRRLRIPVNVSDAPDLCTFTLLSTYSDGPLHIGITTSGRGCKLAARLRREISAYLPSGLGAAVETLGTVRRRIWEEDQTTNMAPENLPFEVDDDDSTAQKHTFNALVTPEDSEAAKTRRMRWLSQICEYWPLRRLASITGADMEAILAAYRSESGKASSTLENGVVLPPRKGKIILAGSGPGHPDLLTQATHNAIKNADLILADKLVPASVLDLIPRRTEVHIARKFPGNADKAQEELLEMGITALQAGKTVLRLKQGDPYLYGRGAEEYDFFRNEGYIPAVLPGITSALSAPLFADIPATHRGVSDQVLICTGTGRNGAAPDPPGYVPTQTVVFLMALHRLSSLIESLTIRPEGDESLAPRALWPKDTPCAVIERASCADQRIIRSTLDHVCLAIQEEGSRPPGLLVVGASCGVLHPLTSAKWTVEDGFKGLDELGREGEMAIINELGAVDKI
ncbi:uroporphyrin-III C-methyltransferase/precorrin-2 dehydrogenase/sirohydrochlorin ferrochelatase [[Emmonsia] crescens]|uniref:Uroporphyrin-III C-methyltransferase/precorrin-2 dehydrogenase/sirohydrochlorin ferrochelatase n=1 Tax=[Emmonsia] crescens TaxID=73230 RepID=A0A0G2IYH1_9EURO|nr:uroporphyrin-III C-methyltransferase/precorrin-2 dehydrogenase/sirohydrochlorin ferrochelatase [Emmonsia crescens UAMH 3008]